MTNSQKGFVVIPIIIWAVVGLFTVAVVRETGLVKLNLSGEGGLLQIKNLTEQQEPSPTPVPMVESDLLIPVKDFYAAISSKEFDSAWNLLSKNFQNYAQNYDNFVSGYKNTLNVVTKDVYVQDLSNKIVYVQIEAKDDLKGQVQTKTFEGIWKLVLEDGKWKLDSSDIILKDVSPTPKPVQVPKTSSPTPKPTSTPTPTPSPTPSPNTGKEQALKMIDGKINKINKDIAFWQNNIQAQVQQFDQGCDNYICTQMINNTIADMRYRIDLLQAEKSALEREKIQIMAQP
ncbi:hypothetical protein HYS91_05175 [Candidatus Daviesbacteria bacterium]|nr:hypothetical protein [Candidatus Daviesbacteria bacterium]